jgi:cytochrome oxidase assembly protein ShyY1
MTFTINENIVYLVITLILMAIQVWQLRKLHLQNKEIDLIWEQIGILAMTTGLNIEKLQKSIDEKESKAKV